MRIKYYEFASRTVLFTRHAKLKRRFMLSYVACNLRQILPHYAVNEKKLLNIKRVL